MTSVHTVMTPLGLAIGASVTQFFVANNPSPAEGLEQVNRMIFYYAIIGSIVLAPTFFFFQDKPPNPPR